MEFKFDELNRYYEDDEFEKIFTDPDGLYFLKLRSLSRSEYLVRLSQKINININEIPKRHLFKYLFCHQININKIDELIKEIYIEERIGRKANEETLYNQLFLLPRMDWGGFYQNAVEKTIVDNYIKKIQRYDELIEKIDSDIGPRLKGYILSSWFNHWTSILIEDMFKDHSDILPAVGLVKKVDFFWHDFPFDLKVTYFPDGFMKDMRKELGLRPELTELKNAARKSGLSINRELKDKELFIDLLTKITENTSSQTKEFIKSFHLQRKKIINLTINEPAKLVKWFYENQGTRRFDSANRLFIVLINRNNLEESWKLKRNKDLLSENINNFLNSNRVIDFNTCKHNFKWKGKDYITNAKCLFIICE
jgi:hypothetical protein